jgi:hypothetical protein
VNYKGPKDKSLKKPKLSGEWRSLYQPTSANQPTLGEVWSGAAGTKLTAERQKDLEKMLLQWIIDQMLPYTAPLWGMNIFNNLFTVRFIWKFF